MTKLWVKFKPNNATRVSTEDCEIVDDLLKACKKELSPHFDSYAPAQLCLSTTDGGTPLQPDDPIPAQNTAKTPLFITVAVVEQAQKEMVSMSYGKATMPFISEATGVEDENQVWENIPVDTTVEASPEFVELFKKNCSVFEFGAEASRRTLIFFFGK
ncbi:hypothetical protein MT418_005920 [Batrachochytrium dendrobatidis]